MDEKALKKLDEKTLTEYVNAHSPFAVNDEPFTVEELDKVGFNTEGSFLFAFDSREAADNQGEIDIGVLCAKLLTRKAQHLITAAPIMYRTLGNEYMMLEGIIANLRSLQNVLKAHGVMVNLEPIASGMEKQQAMILDVRRAVEQGVNVVADELMQAEKNKLDSPHSKG